MYLSTWPIDLANSGLLPLQVPFAVYLFLGWGFVLAALLMTGLTLGRADVAALLRRYLLWRVGWQWYLAALLLAPALMALAVLLNAGLTGASPDFGTVMARGIFGPAVSLPAFILPFFLVDLISNGEEIGWRGYLLPRLQARHNALTASLVLGLVWGLWHLPKYLPHWDPAAFAWFMLHILAYAVVLTWLYNSTRGSLLLTALCHAAANTAGAFLPLGSPAGGLNTYSLFVLLELAAAAAVTLAAGPAHLSGTAPRQIQT